MSTPEAPLSNLHAIVLSGGSGTRFWPLSRDLNPKQLLRVFGAESLLVQAIGRAHAVAGGGVRLLTGERLRDELRDHLAAHPEAGPVELLCEPLARNTAAAIALGAAHALAADPEALVMVLPSDHIVEDAELFARVMREAAHVAASGWLVTVGIEPDAPDTAYGYVRAGAPLPGHEECEPGPVLAEAFVEKPARAAAEAYLAQGGFYWNSGTLVAPAALVLTELERAGDAAATADSAGGRAIAGAARVLAAMPSEDWTGDEARALFEALPSVPFDKAVLEVSGRVAMVPGSFGWSDVGSLLAVERLGDADADGNVLVGRAVDVGSSGTLVYAADRLVATLGLTDALVVDTADATLVTRKDRAQDVRLLVEALRAEGAPEVVRPRTAMRPWGSWTLLLRGEGFQIKSIQVRPGSRLSLQTHERRSEHWIVVRGTARVKIGEVVRDVPANESAYVPAGAKHRLENAGDGPLEVIEVAVGGYLEEDDIVRYDDDWGR